MANATKRYGFFCRPARRTDKVFDELRRIVGLPGLGSDDSVAYIFDILWGMGMEPEVCYKKTVWKSRKTLEETISWQLNRLKGACTMTQEQEEAVLAHLNSISVDGIVEDTTYTTLVTFFWEVKA